MNQRNQNLRELGVLLVTKMKMSSFELFCRFDVCNFKKIAQYDININGARGTAALFLQNDINIYGRTFWERWNIQENLQIYKAHLGGATLRQNVVVKGSV